VLLESETRQGQLGDSNAFLFFGVCFFWRLRDLDFISTNESP